MALWAIKEELPVSISFVAPGRWGESSRSWLCRVYKLTLYDESRENFQIVEKYYRRNLPYKFQVNAV